MNDFLITASDGIAECFRKEGIESVYTVAAENIFPLLKSCLKKGIKIINAKLELGAAFMALTLSRIQGKPAVLIVTSGAGLIGSLSPIAEAMIEGDPLVVIATIPPRNAKTSHMHQLVEYDDQKKIIMPITKAQHRIERPDQIPLKMARAFAEAASGKPGPVYVEIPFDMLDKTGAFNEYKKVPRTIPRLDAESVSRAAQLLVSAELPVILAGRGVYLSDAKEELIALAELIRAPLATTIMSKGLVPFHHPLHVGVAAGRAGNSTAQAILDRSDLVLAVGNRFSELGTGRYSLKFAGRLVHVNIDPKDIGRTFKPDLGIVSDAKEFLMALLSELGHRECRRRKGIESLIANSWRRERKELGNSKEARSRRMIESYDVVDAIRELADDDALIIGDVGAHRIETFLMPVPVPGSYITTTSYISMGMAVPGAVAAAINCPERQVFGIVGDGGFLMTGLEVATAVSCHARPIIVVFNDSSYRVLRIYEGVKYHTVTKPLYELPRTDFAALATALGAKGLKINKKRDLLPVLKEATHFKEGPVVVDIAINPHGIPLPFQRLYGQKDIRKLS
jgi:acetolactate synthase-1/2/3 large subunit